MKKALLAPLFALWLSGCDLPSIWFDFDTNEMQAHFHSMFADQAFKTSIALIELHRIRNGSYPATMNDIEFSGNWDGMHAHAEWVEYRLLGDGYRLRMTNPKALQALSYPERFWSGLGLVETNVGGFPGNDVVQPDTRPETDAPAPGDILAPGGR